MRAITYRQAVNEALDEEISRDPNVFLMGEEVAEYNGAYKISQGLWQKYGAKRIIDAPISETGFAGLGIGAAMVGLRPVIEFMTFSFSLVAFDQIVNNAPNMLTMSGGQFNVPLVVRMATGAGRQLAAQHSHSLEGWYAHVPGLRVLAPATIEDARGMLWPALEDPDPVILFEHAQLYNAEGPPVPATAVDIDHARVRRPGRDLTLITYGGMLPRTLAAAGELARDGIEAEVIDLRVLRPLDDATLCESVRRTHRALVVDEEWRSGSLAAEISARIQEQAFYDLDAPVQRLCAAEVPIPYARHLEEAALPQAATIVAAARAMLGTGGT